MTTDTKQAARERLAIVLPHIRTAARQAVERAEPGVVATLGIIAKNPDGSGQLSAEFELESFLADLELLAKP